MKYCFSIILKLLHWYIVKISQMLFHTSVCVHAYIHPCIHMQTYACTCISVLQHSGGTWGFRGGWKKVIEKVEQAQNNFRLSYAFDPVFIIFYGYIVVETTRSFLNFWSVGLDAYNFWRVKSELERRAKWFSENMCHIHFTNWDSLNILTKIISLLNTTAIILSLAILVTFLAVNRLWIIIL